MGKKQCQICNEETSKYKCPSCLTPYCSLPCFKKHKEVPCSKPAPIETIPALVLHRERSWERSYEVAEESWLLQKAQFEAIATSNEIQDALKDEELRKLVCKIDCSLDAENELDKAMESEDFCVFTDKIHAVISWLGNSILKIDVQLVGSLGNGGLKRTFI